jgi:HPr kinase/phosphorylase
MGYVALTELIEKMELTNLTPELDVKDIRITQPDLNRPALQMTGYFEHFDATRLQVVGFVEYTYMETLSEETRSEIYDELMSYDIHFLQITESDIFNVPQNLTRFDKS